MRPTPAAARPGRATASLAALVLPLALVACGSAKKPAPARHDEPVLRAIYRDGHDTMLLALAPDGRPMRADDCHNALLVDDATGATRQLDQAEVNARLRSMQLAGAAPGDCPRPVRRSPMR